MIAIIFICIMKSHLLAIFVWNFTTTSFSIAEILFFFIKKMVDNCYLQHCQLTHAYWYLLPANIEVSVYVIFA